MTLKNQALILALFFTLCTYAQSISVDSATYTAQQLIEDVLIDSNCISNVIVTNVSGGNFNGSDESYGYFDATGTNFPFQSGVVLSTGRLQNVPGPNLSLSDDDASNWEGDLDLEFALNETNTTNATILEFDFTSVASEISFRYIFASEEYQEGNANSCVYSDLFGFLIRPTSVQQQYENIALVPDTNTPVKVTTVTPGVNGACPPQNETYFGNYNDGNAVINFNGQTAVLTATANVIPNETYHVKLVIADEQNYRYDSVVFLEAGSFQLSTDLGPNRLLATQNALCEGETLELTVNEVGSPSYDWYKDGVLVASEASNCVNCGSYTVTEAGTYTVEVGLANGCISYGEIVVEYSALPVGANAVLVACDSNDDGLSTYNLFEASNELTNFDNGVNLIDFFMSEADAHSYTNPIQDAQNFQNTVPSQIVYGYIVNNANCYNVVELELQTSQNTLNIPDLNGCDGDEVDGFANFDLSAIATSVENQIPAGASLSYYETEADAFSETNALPISYENTTAYNQTIYVKVNNGSQCYSISEVALQVVYTPQLIPDETLVYCTNLYPETLTLYGGVSNDLPNNYYYQWWFNGALTEVNTTFNAINEPGVYTVVVTDPNGCSSSRTITVTTSNTVVIESVSITGVAPNNSVTINVSGDGDYEFSLDSEFGPYQEDPVFTNLAEGFYTLYVRDLNGCATISQELSVLGFPKFFTPNADGDSDYWGVVGDSFVRRSLESVHIFNRYGKLVSVLDANQQTWDGTFNGKALPSDDYWYVALLENGKKYTGHLGLKR
ncbi:T9SS type B sorting domain-containing protein [Winogradskyella rapida]|uniref:Choice-of-anchor L domain-containing protein n=1 Tax=Winogradskyella rapida TaxID=549701 RepID=A0ABW3KTM4_9FLAO